MKREVPSSIRMSSKEFPMGEALIQRTVDCVNIALRENLPPEFYPQLNLTKSRIDFSKTKEEILMIEREKRLSKSQHMYGGLIESGMSPSIINKLFSSIETDYPVPVYWNQSQRRMPIIYVPKNIKHMFSKDQTLGLETSLLLGVQLIENAVGGLAIPIPLPKTPWQEIVKNNMEQFFEGVMEACKDQNTVHPNFDIDKFNLFRQDMDNLLNAEDASFVACGAKVHVLFAGQDLDTSDFAVGSLFNQGVITLITKDIRRMFASKLLQRASRSYQTHPELEESASDIITVLGVNNLSESFLHSKIPLFYSDYRKRQFEKPPIDRIFEIICESTISSLTYPV